jgi:hypothetical protein
MRDLSAAEWALVIRAVAADPELVAELRPLLAGEFGQDARRLVLRCFVARVEAGASARGALVPALADAFLMASELGEDR